MSKLIGRVGSGWEENFRKCIGDSEMKIEKSDILLDCPLCKILGTILKMDSGRTQTNGSEDKKINDDAQGLTFER